MPFYTLSRLKTIDERFKTNYLEVDIVKYLRQTMLRSCKVLNYLNDDVNINKLFK